MIRVAPLICPHCSEAFMPAPLLSKRQKKAVAFVTRHIAAHGCGPTIIEIAAQLGIAKTSAVRCVDALVRLNVLMRRYQGARSAMIALVKPEGASHVRTA